MFLKNMIQKGVEAELRRIKGLEDDKEMEKIFTDHAREKDAQIQAIGKTVKEYKGKYPVGSKIVLLGITMIITKVCSNYPAGGFPVRTSWIYGGNLKEGCFPIEALD